MSTHLLRVPRLRMSGDKPSFPTRLHAVQCEKFTLPQQAAAFVVLGTCSQIATCMLCFTLQHAVTTLLLICAVENLNCV